MKKVLVLFAVVFGLNFLSVNAEAQNAPDAALIGKATATIGDCLAKHRGGNSVIESQVVTTSICFYQGALRTVYFYKTVKCHQEPCPRPIVILVGQVDFGCDDTVINYECY